MIKHALTAAVLATTATSATANTTFENADVIDPALLKALLPYCVAGGMVTERYADYLGGMVNSTIPYFITTWSSEEIDAKCDDLVRLETGFDSHVASVSEAQALDSRGKEVEDRDTTLVKLMSIAIIQNCYAEDFITKQELDLLALLQLDGFDYRHASDEEWEASREEVAKQADALSTTCAHYAEGLRRKFQVLTWVNGLGQ